MRTTHSAPANRYRTPARTSALSRDDGPLRWAAMIVLTGAILLGSAMTARADDCEYDRRGRGCEIERCDRACGDPVEDKIGSVTLADAIHIMRVSVELETCAPCVCDVNGSGRITPADTLTIMRHLVGLGDALICPAY